MTNSPMATEVSAEHVKSISISDSPTLPLSLDERYKICRGVAEECIQEDELWNLLAHKPEPICYDGFEPSGRMHIAQGVLKAISVNKMTASGCRVKILIADWFAMLNAKMGGDLEKIKTVGLYFIEIWRSLGMDVDSGKVEFLWASTEINARADEYWPRVMDIVRQFNLPRIIRCCTIMGRSDEDELTAAQILYTCMQCADIFHLQADICQMGMDQRKVNMLAREYCDGIKKKNKPIIMSHHMLPGLLQGQDKMSKSDPSSSIFMEDEEAEVNRKIEKAYCPPEMVEGNPCLEYVKYLILPWFHEFTIEGSGKNCGNRTFTTFDELGVAYEKGEVHPGDLKMSLAKSLNKILEPVRSHFKNDKSARQLLQSVKASIAEAELAKRTSQLLQKHAVRRPDYENEVIELKLKLKRMEHEAKEAVEMQNLAEKTVDALKARLKSVKAANSAEVQCLVKDACQHLLCDESS